MVPLPMLTHRDDKLREQKEVEKKKQKRYPYGYLLCLAQKERLARLCLAFALRTTDCVQLR